MLYYTPILIIFMTASSPTMNFLCMCYIGIDHLYHLPYSFDYNHGHLYLIFLLDLRHGTSITYRNTIVITLPKTALKSLRFRLFGTVFWQVKITSDQKKIFLCSGPKEALFWVKNNYRCHSSFNPNCFFGGGQDRLCDAEFSENGLCRHHNNTDLIKEYPCLILL